MLLQILFVILYSCSIFEDCYSLSCESVPAPAHKTRTQTSEPQDSQGANVPNTHATQLPSSASAESPENQEAQSRLTAIPTKLQNWLRRVLH